MAAPVKTQATSLLSLQSWATATTLISSAVDVSTKFAGCVYVHWGRGATTALTNNMTFRIEGSAKSTLDGYWFPIYQWQTANGKTAAISGSATAANAGQKVITITSTSFAAGSDKIFCLNGTVGNSEWARTVTKTGSTTLNCEDNLLNAQTTSVITSLAEWWAIPVDLSGVGRLRFVAEGGVVSGVTTYVDAFLTTMDSVA